MYKSYYDKVIETIKETKKYPLVLFSVNVDGSVCLLVKRKDRQYYEKKLQRVEILESSDDMAKHIIACVEAYWTGWGFKKGLRKV